jgi:hypothetical protein
MTLTNTRIAWLGAGLGSLPGRLVADDTELIGNNELSEAPNICS